MSHDKADMREGDMETDTETDMEIVHRKETIVEGTEVIVEIEEIEEIEVEMGEAEEVDRVMEIHYLLEDLLSNQLKMILKNFVKRIISIMLELKSWWTTRVDQKELDSSTATQKKMQTTP